MHWSGSKKPQYSRSSTHVSNRTEWDALRDLAGVGMIEQVARLRYVAQYCTHLAALAATATEAPGTRMDSYGTAYASALDKGVCRKELIT